MTGTRQFPIRFTGQSRAMAVLGITPGSSRVEVGQDEVRVTLSWAFTLVVPRAAVRSAAPDHDRVTGWGAHGWRGTWLVNGSSSGIVRIELDPPGTARVPGLPRSMTTVRVLRVAVEDPDGLIAALDVD
jgi:hypothetical protein